MTLFGTYVSSSNMPRVIYKHAETDKPVSVNHVTRDIGQCQSSGLSYVPLGQYLGPDCPGGYATGTKSKSKSKPKPTRSFPRGVRR